MRLAEKVVVRMPALNHKDYDLNNLTEVIKGEEFKKAIYLASPAFFWKIEEKAFNFNLLNEKEVFTLQKYYNRMSFRCTPFGAFTSIGIAGWNYERQTPSFSKETDRKLKIIADWSLIAIAEKKFKALISNNEQFYFNPSLYKADREYRFIKTEWEYTGKVNYVLESVEATSILEDAHNELSNKSFSCMDISNYLINRYNCSIQEVRSFIDCLIQSNIIFSEATATNLGEDYIERFLPLSYISRSTKDRYVSNLDKETKFVKIEPNCEDLKSMTSAFEKHLEKDHFASKSLLYANTTSSLLTDIPAFYQKQLIESINCLRKLSSSKEVSRIADFKKRFRERYAFRKVPLMEALDPELGIGFGNDFSSVRDADLLDDIELSQIKSKAPIIAWSEIHRLFFNKWKTSLNTTTIDIDDRDLNNLGEGKKYNLPPSTSIIFSIKEGKSIIESVGGSTATGVIGRFTTFDPQIFDFAKDVAKHEKEANPEVVFAEISFLGDRDVDNVNRRLNVYDFEILINAGPSLPKDQQIPLSDLLISLLGDTIILESERKGCRVIPRLSSAYNFHRNDLTVLNFLCELQLDEMDTGLNFDLEELFPGLSYYPDVTYKESVISAAKWYLNENDISKFIEANRREGLNGINKLCLHNGWPSSITINRNDQYLVFNLHNVSEANFFLNCIKSLKKVLIKEYLGPAYGIGAVSEGCCHQFIATLYSDKKVFKGINREVPVDQQSVPRNFAPGSEWVYFKVYCAEEYFNEFLTERFLPQIKLWEYALIKEWFYVKYVDPLPHLRIRLKTAESNSMDIIKDLSKILSKELENGKIRNFCVDVYQREIERYGQEFIELVENCFTNSSNLTIKHLATSQEIGRQGSCHDLAFISIMHIVSSFWETIADQVIFYKNISTSYFEEFNVDKNLRVTLDKKYRMISSNLDQFRLTYSFVADKRYLKEFRNFSESLNALKEKMKLISSGKKQQLLADIIHMHLNRIFNSNQRFNEFVLYYCLHKYYASQEARAIRKDYNQVLLQ